MYNCVFNFYFGISWVIYSSFGNSLGIFVAFGLFHIGS